MEDKLIPMYSPEHDITFVMKECHQTEEYGEVVEQKVVGFYYGMPDEERTESNSYGHITTSFLFHEEEED